MKRVSRTLASERVTSAQTWQSQNKTKDKRSDRAYSRSLRTVTSDTYLTEEQVDDMEDHVEREFCSEKCKKPLGGVHVCFKADIQEVVVQVRNVFLKW